MNPTNHPVVAALLASALALVAPAATPADSHRHERDATPGLSLNHGKQWATDAPLRQGMTQIRGVVEPRLAQVHSGALDSVTYERMANAIEAQLAYIVGNCKLAPEADAVLHAIIGGISEGLQAMRAGQNNEQVKSGIARIVVALNDYGKYFAHPGWQPVHGER